jgi:hypothetical protein
MATAVVTEDLGKIAEKAICDLLNTPYNMKFKYSQERVDALRPRFIALATEFAGYKHTGHTDDLNDFTSPDGSKHLSVKTTKSGWKLCPQIIGQPSRSTFCPTFGLPLDSTNEQIKSYIETNVLTMMPKYCATTFHCPILFYCEKTGLCQLIRVKSPLPWADVTLSFRHQEKNTIWNESATLYAQRPSTSKVTLGEFQVHNHRNCIKFRFDLKNLLTLFPDSFMVQNLTS